MGSLALCVIYLRGNEAAGGEGAVGLGPRTSLSLEVADRWLFVCVCMHVCFTLGVLNIKNTESLIGCFH